MKKRSVIIIVLCITLFFCFHRFLSLPLSVVENVSSYIVYPFLKMQSFVVQPVKQLFEKRKNYQELEQSYNQLITEQELLKAKNIALQASLDFAKDIDEVTEFSKQYDYSKKVLTQILFRQFSDKMHFMLVDAGRNKGITKNMIAVYNNCIVGRVSEVYPYYAKVILVTDQSCKIAAYCSQTGACGIHEGVNNDQQTNLSYVSHLQKIQQDDLLLTSGEGLVFPRGFALGTISQFHHDGLQYTIKIKPLLDLHKLQYCYLIEKGA